jgi:L-ribulokinase
MQIYADVCNRPMKISRSPQTCALGAAIFGAVAGGAYENVQQAQAKMTGVKKKMFLPDTERAAVYAELYPLYKQLHDAFGSTGERSDGLSRVMKELITIRSRVRKG